MTPLELIERLETLGLVDPKVLKKIRRQIDDPEKTVKPKAVVTYLAKKGLIDKSQASALIKEIEKPKPIQHEEIAVAVPAEKEYDTDDLTAAVHEVVPAPDPQATMEAVPANIDDSPGDIEVDVVAVEPIEAIVEPEPIPYEAAIEADPLDAGGGDAFDNFGAAAAYDDATKDETKSAGFQGKRLKKDQWATKWLYIGFGILGSLLIFGAVLYIAVNRVSAEDQFKAAMTSFENSAWGDFLEKIDEFMEDNPRHEKVGTAKARRVQALIAQTYESKNWNETISRAADKLPTLMEDKEAKVDLIRDDLGVMLPGAALKISERALKQNSLADMEKQLEMAYEAKTVVDNATYIPSSIRKRPVVADTLSKFEDNIRAVKGLIQKENDYSSGLSEIKELGAAGKTDIAFTKYQELTRKYGELATRAELRTAMKEVSAKERELVNPINAELAVSTDARSSDSQGVVVLATKTGQMLEASRELMEVVLAEGSLYGIETGSGRVVWRKWLGYETLLQPVKFDEDYVLVSEQMNNDVMMVRKMDGKVMWRTEIGEPFVLPAHSPAMVLITATSGKIFKLDAQTGNVVASVKLPQTANVSAMIAERDPYIYQVGYYSNIYVLSADDLSCKDVYNLGHYKGSIEVPPKYWSGHLLTCVNSGNRCDLHVLKPAQDGLGLERVQLMNRITAGPVTTPLTRLGRWMLLAADNGEMKILNLDPDPEQIPISKFAEEKFENRSGQRVFMATQGSQLWVAGKGIMKYRIQGSLGQFNRQIITNHADSFIGPMTPIEEGLMHVRRREGSGMVSVSAVAQDSLKEIWRTDLGGAIAGAPTYVGNKLQAISNQGDVFMLDSQSFTDGYADSPTRASTVIENLSFDMTIQLGDDEYAVVGTSGRDDLLHIKDGKSRLLKLQPPANKPVCKPLALGGDLIVGSADGQVVRVEMRSGKMIGAPFQPAVKPGSIVDWKDPVLIQGEIFAIANGSEDGASSVYVLDASDGKSIRKIAGVDSDAKIRSRLAAIGRSVYVVVSGNDGDQIVALDAANSLNRVSDAALNAGYVDGPWAVGESILLVDDSDQLVCYDSKLAEKWKSPLANIKLAGEPVLDRGKIAIAFQDGQVVWVNPEDGKAANSVQLGQPISGVSFADNKLLFGGLDGTVQVWQGQ